MLPAYWKLVVHLQYDKLVSNYIIPMFNLNIHRNKNENGLCVVGETQEQ